MLATRSKPLLLSFLSMTAIQVANQTITADEIIPLLANYQILAKLSRELFIDRAIESTSCTPTEKAQAIQQFDRQNGLDSASACNLWLRKHCITIEQKEALAIRKFKIEKFKQATWETKVGAYFIRRKKQLDRVVFSIIQTKELELAQELYFRLLAGEESFSNLAKQYSQGAEALTGGFVSPTELGHLPSTLAKILSTTQPGQIHPISYEGWQMIVRLEKLIPARLDRAMHRRLIDELFELWLNRQLDRLPPIREEIFS